MIEILLYSVLIMLASLVGVFSVWRRAGRAIERNLNLLVSFSAGVFIVIAYQLGIEVVEHSATLGSGLVWIVIGLLTVWLLFKFLPSSHHHHDEASETHPHSRLDARRIMASDALHNLGDGILLATSFAVSSSLGMLTALSIFVHELVQEISEFFVLRQAGYSTKSALILNFAISATVLLGALGGFFLLESFETLEVPLLGLASGAFLVVVFHDLIPHSVRSSRHENLYWRHLLWFLVGMVLMFVVSTFTAH
ncbi:MAG: Zinc/iron permease [Parcubacteria group bacterium GW2011_GWF2_44_8b]|nr:MAG: Zinc/iron permease [Parcubacteria group bacterium GW2011_GWC1_43_30]KKT79413.1 MAG: Zinc/iron permease [Parcubacteria group bacterium GW2011_GWF2_44_8b]KKT85806.1 MAG: Zinc/iron permease [Parcubacteria group bacterium GW2011_GWD1_44_9]